MARVWEYITSNRYYFQWSLSWLQLITKNLAQLIKPVKLKQIEFLAENLVMQRSLSFTNEISLKGFALWFKFQKVKLMSYQIGAAESSIEEELTSIKRDLIRERDLPPIRVNNCSFDLKLKQQWVALHEHYFHQSEALQALHNFESIIIDNTCSINPTCKVLVDDIITSLKAVIDNLSPHFNLTYAFKSIQLYYSILNQYNYNLDYQTGCLDLTKPITWQAYTTPCLIDPVDLILTNKLKLTNPSIPLAIKSELNFKLKKLVKRVELPLKPSQLEDFSFNLEDFITIMANFVNTPIWNNILIQLFPKLHWKAYNNDSKLTLKDIELFLINLIVEKLTLIMSAYKIQEFSQFQLIWQKSQNFINKNQNSFWLRCKLQFGNLTKLKHQIELMPDQVFNRCLEEIRGQNIHISHWSQFQFIEDLYARLGARLTKDHYLYHHYNNFKLNLKFVKFDNFLIIRKLEVKKTLRPILYFHTVKNIPQISEDNKNRKYITGVKIVQQTNYSELTQSQLEYLIKCNLQIEAQQKPNINTEFAALLTETSTNLKKEKFTRSTAITKPKMLSLKESTNCPNLVPDDLCSPNLSPCTLITPIDSHFSSYPRLA